MSQQDLNKLRTFQIRYLRDILGLTLWDKVRNTTILERTGELPVEEQLWQRKLQWFGHVWRMPAHCPQRPVLRCRSIGRKRPPGGTPLCRCDLLNDDLKGMRNWSKAIEDRAEWRTTIHANQPTRVPLGQQHPNPAQCPEWTWRMKEGRCVCVYNAKTVHKPSPLNRRNDIRRGMPLGITYLQQVTATDVRYVATASCLVLATRTTAVSRKPNQLYWREMPFTTAAYNVRESSGATKT